MKKITITLLTLVCSTFTFAQVGVNTTDPKATFDITAKTSKGKFETPEGLLIPRVDRERAQSMIGTAISTLIYVDDVTTGLQTGTAINIDAAGYYYFDGRFWMKLNTNSAISPMVNIYNTDGSLTANRTVSQQDKTLAYNATAVNAFSVNKNSEANPILSVDATNSRIGIVNKTPATPLDILTGRGYGFQHSDGTIKLRTFLGANAANGNAQAAWIGTFSEHPLDLMTNDLPRLRISETGNVGIGTSSPQRKLDVSGSMNINAAITKSTTANALDINIGQDGYTYGSRGDNFGINMRTSSTSQTGDIARINFGDTGAVSNTGNRYLSFSVGKNLRELMYMDNINNGRVGIGTNTPSSSAILELSSTNQGFLPPRLTTAQRDAISTKVAGLMIYNTDTNCMNFWNTKEWVSSCAASAPTPGAITALTCTSATNNGSLFAGTVASGTSSSIPYTGGNGGSHGGQTVTSTGVTGLTATLAAGSFASGNGNVTYTISGTPSGAGNANFALNIGGKTCTLTRTVTIPAGTVASLNCAGATNNGTLTASSAASGVSSSIPYTGGNAGTYTAQTVSSTGVAGLTATLSAGTLANGNGNLTYTITGTPSGSGTANFAINVGGRTCTLTRTVAGAANPPAADTSDACNGWTLPFASGNSYTTSTNLNGQTLTATVTKSNNSYVESVPARTNCGVSTTDGAAFTFTYTQEWLTVKFDKPVSNLKVYQAALANRSGGDKVRFTFKRNGVEIIPGSVFIKNPCNNFNWFGDTTVGRVNLGTSFSGGAIYNFGGVWFDEVTITPLSESGSSFGSHFSLCVGSVQ